MEIAGEKFEIEAMGQYIVKQIEAGQAYTVMFSTSDELCKDYSDAEFPITPKRKEVS